MATYYIYHGEKPILEYRSTDLGNPAKNVYGKGIDEPSEWGHREMDGQARERQKGSGLSIDTASDEVPSLSHGSATAG